MSRDKRQWIRASQPVELDGKTYPSLRQLCDERGLPFRVVQQRLYAGRNIVESIALPIRTRSTDVAVRGKSFSSPTDACRFYGVKFRAVSRHVQHGHTLEKAIDIEVERKKSKKSFDFEGNTFETLTDVARSAGIQYRQLHYLCSRGFGVVDAVQLLRVADRPIIFNGIEYSSLASLCQGVGIREADVRSAYYAGMSIADAIIHVQTLPTVSPQNCKSFELDTPLVIDGKTFHTIGDVARHYSIPPRRLYRLVVEEGMALVKAVRRQGPEQYHYAGITHRSITALARSCNISHRRLYYHFVERGLDIDAAVAAAQVEISKQKKIYTSTEGEEFQNYREFCAHVGVSFDAISRIRKKHPHLSFEAAAEQVIKNRIGGRRKGRPIPVTFEGTEYRSVRALCAKLEINYNIVNVNMVKNNKSLDEAITIARRQASKTFVDQ